MDEYDYWQDEIDELEIVVKAMDDAGVEKEFYFNSMNELKEWWKKPYETK